MTLESAVRAAGPPFARPARTARIYSSTRVFAEIDGALAALGAVERDYARHARAAEELAARYFDSDRVLAESLDIAGV